MKRGTLISMVISVLLALSWFGDIHADEVKITAGDGAKEDYFGYPVNIFGDYAIVGASGHDSSKGAAYIFKRQGTSWEQEAKLTAQDGAKEDYFGYSVAISDDYAIVGAIGDDDMGEDTGSVYFFKRSGTSWKQEVKFTPHGPAILWCTFGYSIDISGDYVIVGSKDESGASGAVYIFHYDGNSWKEQAKFTAKDNARKDKFGCAVSMDGDYAIVGADGDQDKGDWTGSAYIFKREGTSWKEQAKLTASDAAAKDQFGYSVYISGDYAIVGAGWDDDKWESSGSAYIFKREGTSWIEQAKITASDGAAWHCFGIAVYISDDYAIVSAPYDASGSIYVFLRSGTSWKEASKHTASDGAAMDYFGTSVSVSGDYAIAGANGDDDKGLDSGSAYIYHAKDLGLPGKAMESQGKLPTTWGMVKSNRLYQNYPNPFNPETWIPFLLAEPADVTIHIYVQSGQLVRTLSLGLKEAGMYLEKSQAGYWDGRNDAGEPVASGVYFYQLDAGGFSQTRKMAVLK